MMAAKKSTNKRPETGGNVFADLGLPNPEQELIKAELTFHIHTLIQERRITQAEAGRILGIKQPQVSLLMGNRGGSFSVGRLLEFLNALGQDVEITLRPTPKKARRGEMSLRVA